MRGVAAMLVLWFHLHLSHHVRFYPSRGYLAVDFFFMLSGYVMARTYEGRIQGGLWFLRKRIHRLWPTVAFGSVLGLWVLWRGSSGPFDFITIAALNLLLLPALWAGAAFPLNSPAWSIFFELFANAVHGFGLHRLKTSALAATVAGAGIITLAIAVRAGSLSLGSDSRDFVGGFPRVIFAYFLGVILYRTWRDRPPIRLHPALLAAIIGFLFTPREPISDFLFVAIACPLIVATGIAASPGRWASLSGALSFPLYAVHRPILAIAALVGAGWFAGASAAMLVAAILLLIPRSIDFAPKHRIAVHRSGRAADLEGVPIVVGERAL